MLQFNREGSRLLLASRQKPGIDDYRSWLDQLCSKGSQASHGRLVKLSWRYPSQMVATRVGYLLRLPLLQLMSKHEFKWDILSRTLTQEAPTVEFLAFPFGEELPESVLSDPDVEVVDRFYLSDSFFDTKGKGRGLQELLDLFKGRGDLFFEMASASHPFLLSHVWEVSFGFDPSKLGDIAAVCRPGHPDPDAVSCCEGTVRLPSYEEAKTETATDSEIARIPLEIEKIHVQIPGFAVCPIPVVSAGELFAGSDDVESVADLLSLDRFPSATRALVQVWTKYLQKKKTVVRAALAQSGFVPPSDYATNDGIIDKNRTEAVGELKEWHHWTSNGRMKLFVATRDDAAASQYLRQEARKRNEWKESLPLDQQKLLYPETDCRQLISKDLLISASREIMQWFTFYRDAEHLLRDGRRSRSRSDDDVKQLSITEYNRFATSSYDAPFSITLKLRQSAESCQYSTLFSAWVQALDFFIAVYGKTAWVQLPHTCKLIDTARERKRLNVYYSFLSSVSTHCYPAAKVLEVLSSKPNPRSPKNLAKKIEQPLYFFERIKKSIVLREFLQPSEELSAKSQISIAEQQYLKKKREEQKNTRKRRELARKKETVRNKDEAVVSLDLLSTCGKNSSAALSASAPGT